MTTFSSLILDYCHFKLEFKTFFQIRYFVYVIFPTYFFLNSQYWQISFYLSLSPQKLCNSLPHPLCWCFKDYCIPLFPRHSQLIVTQQFVLALGICLLNYFYSSKFRNSRDFLIATNHYKYFWGNPIIKIVFGMKFYFFETRFNYILLGKI